MAETTQNFQEGSASNRLPDGTLLCGGRYRIVRFISAGGFGCTYEAVETYMGISVCLKEFFVSQFCNREADGKTVTVGTLSQTELVEKLRQKFKDEALRIYSLKHGGVVRVSAVFDENGTSYYAMDYIRGKSLQAISEERGPLPEAEAVRYIRQVSDALGYVHSRHIMHLDIKPSNIMIDESGNAVLIDFGVSKQYDEASGSNTSTLLGFSAGYAPIEQMSNKVRQLEPPSDIYALGATLYTLLSAKTPPSSIDRISGDETEPLPPTVSAATRTAVERAMRLDRKQRPQTVAAFLSVLDSNSGKPPKPKADGQKKASKPEPDPSATKIVSNKVPKKPRGAGRSSRKWLWATIAIGVLAIICGGVLFFLLREPTKAEFDDSTLAASVSGITNGHEWVDMGTSVKWATCNVGANSPSEYGDYFAWGETSTKDSYTIENCANRKKCIGSIAGYSDYDVATNKWGAGWRMPTREEFQELIDRCEWQWVNGGMKVTAKNGHSIFFPAAGHRYNSRCPSGGEFGLYWSASPSDYEGDTSYSLVFRSDSEDVHCCGSFTGRPVRPVIG